MLTGYDSIRFNDSMRTIDICCDWTDDICWSHQPEAYMMSGKRTKECKCCNAVARFYRSAVCDVSREVKTQELITLLCQQPVQKLTQEYACRNKQEQCQFTDSVYGIRKNLLVQQLQSY